MSKWIVGIIAALLIIGGVSAFGSQVTGLVVGSNSQPTIASLVSDYNIDNTIGVTDDDSNCAVFNVAGDKPSSQQSGATYCEERGFNQCSHIGAYSSSGFVEADCQLNKIAAPANNLQICAFLPNPRKCTNLNAITVTCCQTKVKYDGSAKAVSKTGSTITANAVARGGTPPNRPTRCTGVIDLLLGRCRVRHI